MVLEAIVAEVLNQFLSKFIENVDKKQLSISIWGGDVVLEKLILREDALNNVDFPVRTTYGHLGKLVLKIPWKKLYTAPVIISVDSLFLLAAPNRDVVYDPDQEERLKQQAKQRELKRIEEAKRQSETAQTTNIDTTFVEKLVAQIIKNIQIKVNNVHIRYEDRISHPGKPFAIGLTLNRLYLYSTDSKWKETIITENVKTINKVMVIDSLAIYWNCKTKVLKNYIPRGIERVLKVLLNTICTKDFQPQNYQYILGPINATVRLLLNTKPELDEFLLPKYDLNIQLSTLSLGIDRLQYHDAIMLTDSLNCMKMSARYRKYRPNLNVYKGYYNVWWRFAYDCILEEFVKPKHINFTWEYIAAHRARCHEYASAYQSKLKQSKYSKELESHLKELENELDVFNIILIREQVQLQLEKIRSFKPEIVNSWWSWVNSFQFVKWFRGVDQDIDTSNVHLRLAKMMTPKEKEKLYKAIGYDVRSDREGYPDTFVNILVRFNLKTFQIKITDNLSCVLDIKLSQVKIDFERRPIRDGIKVNMGILKLAVYGLEQDSFIPLLVESKEVEKEKLLDVLFEVNPLDGKSDHRLHLNFRTLQIVFDLKTTTKILEIFRATKLKSFNRLQYHIENVKHMSVSGLRYAIEQQKALDLKVDIKSPYVIVPYRGIYTRNEDILIINLGQFKMNSSPITTLSLTRDTLVRKGISNHGLMDTLISHSYEKFTLNLDSMQILISLKGEDWLEVLKQNTLTPLHILRPVSLVAIYNKCLVQDDPKLPKKKITLSIPKVEIIILNTRLLRVLVLLYSILVSNLEDIEQLESVDLEKQLRRASSLHDQIVWATQSVKYIPQADEDEEDSGDIAVKKVQAIQLDLTAQIEQVSIFCVLAKGRASTPLLTLKLIKMELQMVQFTFNIDIVARLGGICADGYIRKRAIRLVSTPMTDTRLKATDYLFIVDYVNVDKESPEFVSKYEGVMQFLKVDFTRLSLVFYQEIIVELLEIIEAFVENLKEEFKRLQENALIAKISKSKITETRKKIMARMYEDSTAVVQTKLIQSNLETDFILQANLNQLTVTIANVGMPIANIGIERCYFKGIFNPTQTKVILRLETIQVIDCLKQTLHRRILSVVGEEAVSLEITIRNKVHFFTHSKEQYPDMFLSAKIACIRIVYINRLFSMFLNFYNNVKTATMSFIKSTFIYDQSDEYTTPEIEDASFIKTNIDIDAPIIIVPINSKSLEAVMLDFGFLTISNEAQSLEIVNSDGVRAIVDYMKVKFSNVRVNRVTLTEDYETLSDISMIDPVSFSIHIERNLSLSWYRNIPNCSILLQLHAINVILTEDDYKMIMKIMTQNFSETYAVSTHGKSTNVKTVSAKSLHKNERIILFDESSTEIEQTETKKDTESIIFTLQFIVDSISITLYEGGTNLHRRFSQTTTKSLTCATLQTLLVHGIQMSGGKTTWTFRMENCFLDDVRGEQHDQNTRLFQCKDPLMSDDNPACNLEIMPTLINVIVETKDKFTLIDISGNSFQLIVSLEYVLKLKAFFLSYRKDLDSMPNSEFLSQSSSTIFGGKSYLQLSATRATNDTCTCVNMKLNKSEIFIVESITDPDCDALTTSVEIESTLRMSGDVMVLNLALRDIYLNSCCFNLLKRKTTVSLILRPCNISVVAAALQRGSMNLDVCLTEIRTSISPKILNICKKMMALMYENVSKTIKIDNDKDYSGVWEPRAFSEDEFWFLRNQNTSKPRANDYSTNIRSTHSLQTAAETCVISVPSFTILVEAEEGQKRFPLLFVQTKIDCIIYDWSSNLLVSSNLFLQVEFYHNNLGVWEPLIEPVEKKVKNKSVFQLWELKIEFQMKPQSQQSSENELNTGIVINITSREKLELTLTKTSIGVLSNCAQLLLESTEKDFSTSGGALAPYLFKNMSGLPVLVMLSKGSFQHANLPDSKATRDQMLPVGAQLEMKVRNEELLLTEEDKVEFNSESLNVFTYRFLDLRVRVSEDHDLTVPVFRSAMRYFSLNHLGEYGDPWGLLWQVKVFEGGTIVVLHGVLQIYNHLRQPVYVHCLPKEGAALARVGTVMPYSELNLPPDSIYTEMGALFFNVAGYKITKEPFMWKQMKKTPIVTKLLQCGTAKPKAGEPLFLNIVGLSKKVYFENTVHYSPDSYAYEIHIQPSVMVKNLLPVDIVVCVRSSLFEENITIKAGEQMQMVNVQPRTTQMFVTIPNYMNNEWKSTTHIEWDTEIFKVLRLVTTNETNAKQLLEIRVFTKENKGTIWKELSSQFWLLNKTSILLAYRQCNKHENTITQEPDFRDVILFSYWGSSKANKMSIKILNGEWSNKISLDAAGSSGVVSCKVGNQTRYIGVHISLTHTKLTKQVTFTPYYVLLNNHEMCIQCQEADCPNSPWIDIKPGNCTPFWPVSSANIKELVVRIETSIEMSAPFSYSSVHTTLVQLHNKFGAVFVDIHKMEGAIYVTFWPYKPGLAPSLLINYTPYPISVSQKNEENVSILNPKEVVLFAWKKPTGSRNVVFKLRDNVELTDDLQKDGVQGLALKSENRVYWVSFLDGTQRTTLFTTDPVLAYNVQTLSTLEPTDTELILSINSVGISFVNNTIMKEVFYISIGSYDATWQSRKHNKKHFRNIPRDDSELIENAYKKYQEEIMLGRDIKTVIKLGTRFVVDLEKNELVQPSRMYLRRTFQEGLWVQMQMSHHQITFHGKVSRLQIDNQLTESVFPVMLAPVPPPKSVSEDRERKPFVEWSIVRRFMEHSPVQHYKYFMILIQAFHVKLEMDFLKALSEMYDLEQQPEAVQVVLFAKDLQVAMEPLRTSVDSASTQEEKSFYDILHFSPLKIHVSFSLFSNQEQDLNEHTLPFIMIILHGLGVTLTDVHNVILKLDYFQRKYTFLSYKQMLTEVSTHYISQILKQTYVLVLGLDLIGNPWGLLMGVREGMSDLFYEPYQGAIQGPGEFVEGVQLGVRRMFGQTLGGTFGAFSHISSAIGTGISILTFDNRFQYRRLQAINQATGNVPTAVVQGGKDLAMGVVEGVSGVVTSPVSGARQEGVRGFFKGVGKGLAGLATRPVIGVFDFVSGSLRAVSLAADVNREVTRVRPPRYLARDGLVRPYSRAQSEGNMLLVQLRQGRFAETDTYEYHLSGINESKDVVLLTDKRIMYLKPGSFVKYSVARQYAWNAIYPPVNTKEGILITPITNMKKSTISRSNRNERCIPIKNNKKKLILLRAIQKILDKQDIAY